MSTKGRFNVVVFLGVVYLGLVLHNVASFRLAVILGGRPVGYAFGRLPGSPAAVIGAALAAVAGFLAVVWLANRRLSPGAGGWRGRAIVFVTAMLFVAAG